MPAIRRLDIKKYSIGLSLRRLRAAKQLTQETLADLSGIDYRHLQSIEADKIDIKISTVNKLASALNIPICHLLQPLVQTDVGDRLLFCSLAILEDLGVGIQICDMDGLIKYQNRMMQSLHGRRSDELRIYDLYSAAKDVKRLKEELKILARSAARSATIHSSIKSADGELVLVTEYWHCLHGSDNSPIGFTAAVIPETVSKEVVKK